MTFNIKKIAKAGGIKLNLDEEKIFELQFTPILGMLNQLKTVDTTGIEPLMTVYQGNLRLREDIAIDPQSADTVMQSTNNSRYNYFVTPKFVD
jgi:aspartyl-tRNA(Asn)/glutamyl-tRNA(Gln) amidotransferase subunit C